MGTMPPDKHPRTEALERQKSRLEATLARLDGLDRRFVVARLASFSSVVVALLVILFFQLGAPSLWIPAAFLTAFAGVVFFHRRLDRSRLRFRLALALVMTQLARLELEWPGLPPASSLRVEPDHPFAADLDILGERSLHRLVDTAASHGGSQRLAAWLLAPLPDPPTIQRRQALLQELIPLAGFRSRLALTGRLIREGTQGQWDGEKVMRWLRVETAPVSLLPLLVLLFALAAVNIVLLILNLSGALPPYWIAGVGLYAFIYLSRYSSYRSLFEDTYQVGKSLDQLRTMLVFLERSAYTRTPYLAEVCRPLTGAEKRPSRLLRRFVWLTIEASLGNNLVLAGILNGLLPWNLFFAYLLNGYKQELRGSMEAWLDAWYEVEALCSLANFAWLNPGYRFPRIITGEFQPGQGVFSARGLGHPLIPERKRVCNDWAIPGLGSVALITGSNMSGKSTFLRTVGINLCLANAGAPVAATEMRAWLFRPFTCIQVRDSLADGISYFYAEVRRLKQLLSELEKPSPYPVFFLIDEIYRGTNNRERRIGSQAYIHALSRSQGVGLVSTHDLDLAQLSDVESAVSNYHFQEEIRDDRMAYDYRLRPGPSPTTNALRIMEMEGLPVDGGGIGDSNQ